MTDYVRFVEKKRLERVKAALEQNQMVPYLVDSAAEVLPLVKKLIPAGSKVACGGSLTLEACGVLELFRSGDYTYFDRYDPAKDQAEQMHLAFGADWYLASANALTEKGEIYEMDGRGNRVAALSYGPQNVLLVVGCNKIVEDVEAARKRNARLAAPANTHKLGLATPCATTGVCVDCKSPARICSIELVLRQQMVKDRIHVILVNEELGN